MGRRYQDPITPGVIAPRQPDGNPPQEVIDQFLEDARSQGCTCKPSVNVRRGLDGGGEISLGHKSHCPLLQVLRESGS